MVRLFSESILLFFLPFAAYAGLLVARQRWPFVRDAWSSGRIIPMAAMGLVCAILGLVGLGLLGQRHRGAYRPAHLDHGQLVPGRME